MNGCVISTDESGNETVNEEALYTYRLRFIMNTASKKDLEYAYIYDEMEQFVDTEHPGDADASKSQWQGTVRSVDVSNIIALRKAHGINAQPVVYYTTDSSQTYATLPTATFNTITDVDPSQMHDYLTGSNTKWKTMSSEDNDGDGLYEIWKPETSDKAYAICVELIAKDVEGNQALKDIPANYKNIFQTDVYVEMLAPVATANNIQKKARNRSYSIYHIEDLDMKSKQAEITSVRLANNLKIMKVDFEYPTKGLYGAKFSVFTLPENNTQLTYATQNTVTINEEDGRNIYTTVDMKNLSTNASGLLEMPLASGTYYIQETQAPNHYMQNNTVYKITFTETGQAEYGGEYEPTTSAQDTVFTITDDGKTTSFKQVIDTTNSLIEVKNNNNGLISIKNKLDAKSMVFLTKTDSDSGTLVNGAVYELLRYAEDDEPLPVSVYKNTETYGGKIYEYYDCTNSAGSEASDGVKSGEGVYISLIPKTEEDGKTLVRDAEGNIEIDHMEKIVQNGLIVIRNLEPGMYVLREKNSLPDGYLISNDDIEFTISFDNMVKYTDTASTPYTEYTIAMLNGFNTPLQLEDEEQPCSITMKKIDKDDNTNKIQGARYELYQLNPKPSDSELTDEKWREEAVNIRKKWATSSETDISYYWNGPIGTATSTSGGNVTFSGIKFGTYMIMEKRAAPGYKINYGYIYEKNEKDEDVLKCAYTSDENCVDEDGIITIDVAVAHAHLNMNISLSHKEEEKTGSVRINKYNLQSDGSELSLANAVFEIYKKANDAPQYFGYDEEAKADVFKVVVDETPIYYTLKFTKNTKGEVIQSINTQYTLNANNEKVSDTTDIASLIDTRIGEYTTASTGDFKGWTEIIRELKWGKYYIIENSSFWI